MAEKKYILIYADVDDTKPEHKQMLAERAWTEELSEDEETQYAAIREDFVASLPDSDGPFWKFKERSKDRKQSEKIEDIFFEEYLFDGWLHPDLKITDFLLGLESPQDRQRFLQMFCGKTRVKHKRPIMLLIRMIDTERTTVPDSTGGYAIAFNVLEERLIIRSFYSDRNTHPLCSPWTNADPRDPISFYGTPLEFARKFILWIPELNTDDECLRLLVHAHAIKFLLDHWTNLFQSALSTEKSEFLQSEIRDIYDKSTPIIRTFRFHTGEKAVGAAPTALKKFRDLRDDLVEEEDQFRADALNAKRDGKEKVAENAEKVYGKLLSTINAFLEDPTKEP